MINMSYEQIVEKIQENTSLNDNDINDKIQAKIDVLSGLVSKEGAAYIVANELGVKLVDLSSKSIKISNIAEGLRNVSIIAKILRIYDTREFKVSARQGKLRSFVIGDESGNIRVVLWNDAVDLLNDAKVDDIADIKGLYVRKNNGVLELHSTNSVSIDLNPEGITVEAKPLPQKTQNNYVRYYVKDIKLDHVGSYAKINGVVVNAFDPIYFKLCPHCRHKVYEKENGFYCDDHNLVQPIESYVSSILVDDGTDVIRVTLWKNQIDKIGLENLPTMVGKLVVIGGKVNKNYQSDKVELTANFITDADPDEEMKHIESLQKI